MASSVNDQSATDTGAGSSTGLSLREKMRLKAQQKLQDQRQAAPPSPPRTYTDTTSLVAADPGSEDEALGSLTLARTKRQAALKRPATYSIDPLDDASRLRHHPNKLPSSAATHVASPSKRIKGVDSLLREQQRRIKRGTDSDGFSRADAIARSMEQERLGRMGIAYPAENGDADDQHRNSGTSPLGSFKTMQANVTKSTEPELTVKALSPTIPSFLWSSQSEVAPSDDEMEHERHSSVQERRLEASLTAVGADEDQKRQALEILRRDLRDGKRGSTNEPKRHISFWRPGRTLAPIVTFFCPLPSLSDTKQEQGPSTSSSTAKDLDWNVISEPILMAGILPGSLELDKRQIRRILVWSGISYILERNVFRSRLLLAFFWSMVSKSAQSPYRRQLESAVPKALTDIVRRVPHILHRIGIDEEVLEECFPDNANVTNVPCFTVAQRKPCSQGHTRDGASSSSPSIELKEFKAYLTQMERHDLVGNLARVIEMVARASSGADVVEDNVSVFAGYVSSMTIACAATMNLRLQRKVGGAFRCIFESAGRAGGVVLLALQEEVSRRMFSALAMDSVVVRARLVTAMPGDGREVAAVRRWLAWCILTEHLSPHHAVVASPHVRKPRMEAVPSSDSAVDAGEDVEQIPGENAYWKRCRFEPFSLDLDKLASAIDSSNPQSPFYIAPTPRTSGITGNSDENGTTTSFETLIAATHLVSLLLRDLPLHLCHFPPSPSRSTPTVENPHGREPTTLSRPLRLSLQSYMHLTPELDKARIAAVRTCVRRLEAVNARIRDNRADVIARTLAKDCLQSTCLASEYQLDFYSPASMNAASFLA